MIRLRIVRNVPTMVSAAGLLLLSALQPQTVRAQELRGVVLRADGAPASGVVAVMLHATRDDSIVARTVTNERGRFSLRPPALLNARLRFLRIGYEATSAGTYSLALGQIKDSTFTLPENRLVLATREVRSQSRCQVRPEGSELVAQLFQQVRTALIATTARGSGQVAAQFTTFNRMQDRGGRLLSRISRVTINGETLRPYASLNVDSLDRVGYIVDDDAGGATYYAPDADVLLSDTFLARHCLQLVVNKDSSSKVVGVQFRPVGRRNNVVDVQGTLWLDRTTSELQFLEFEYTPLPADLRIARLGGRVDYARLTNGIWIVSDWSIRMPITTSRVDLRMRQSSTLEVSGQQIAGGAVESVRIDDQVLFLNSSALLAGAMPGDERDPRDKVIGLVQPAFLAGANITGTLCTRGEELELSGSVSGRVYDEHQRTFPGASVRALWNQDFRIKESMGVMINWTVRTVQTTSSTDGVYYLCGLPLERGVRVAARRTAKWEPASIVRLSEETKHANLDIKLAPLTGDDRPSATTAQRAESGGNRTTAPATVEASADPRTTLLITSAAGTPLPFAFVSVNGGAERLADSLGRVAVPTIGIDTIEVSVRRAGYRFYDGRIARPSPDVAFTLSVIPLVISANGVSIMTSVDALNRTGFYSRMLAAQSGAGAGEFASPEKLGLRVFNTVSSMFSNSRFVKIETRNLVSSLRGQDGCPATVLIDGERAAQSTAGIDSELAPQDVMAFEVYRTLDTTPETVKNFLAGETGAAPCAVVVLWTGAR